jgi:hypothetical protein
VARVVLRTLAKSPEKRFPDMAALARALADAGAAAGIAEGQLPDVPGGTGAAIQAMPEGEGGGEPKAGPTVILSEPPEIPSGVDGDPVGERRAIVLLWVILAAIASAVAVAWLSAVD